MREPGSIHQKVIPLYSDETIENIREACRIGRKVLDAAHRAIAIGVTCDEIDVIVHEATIEEDAYPSPLNYYDFPKSVCTSVNEVICHGIPDLRPLENGDIVNVDVSVFKRGVNSDLNETYLVGECDEKSKHLVKNAYLSLKAAVAMLKPNVMYRDIGKAIAGHAESQGLSVVKSYCGHGVGENFHCMPNVPHYKNNKAVGITKPGHIFTIEPMINMGTWQDVTWAD